MAALKSAPTSSDQHKIAFTIQQILDLLNEAGKEGLLTSPLGMAEGSSRKKVPPRLPDSRAVPVNSRRSSGTTSKPQMEDSLVSKLVDADVLEVVEPFWISEFHEVCCVVPGRLCADHFY